MRDIESRSRGVGLLDVFSNKAGLAIRCRIHNANYTFINCHLQAHSGIKNQRTRRRQIEELGRVFQTHPHPYADTHVLWCGDFNFRVELPASQTHSLIEDGAYESLLRHDDRPSDLLPVEGEISFAPTYKFHVNAATGELEYNWKRGPSYCDRIFYVGGGAEGTESLAPSPSQSSSSPSPSPLYHHTITITMTIHRFHHYRHHHCNRYHHLRHHHYHHRCLRADKGYLSCRNGWRSLFILSIIHESFQ